MSAAVATFAGSAASSLLSRRGSSSANRTAGYIVPRKINTGRSNIDTRTGQINLDPTIRQGQEDYRTNIRDLIDPVNAAFDTSSSGIRDLQTRSSGLRADYEGNESDFREAQLAGTRESIANRTGELSRELGRTGVRGTFAEQAKTGLALDSARELRRAEGEIEKQRIDTLGQFLQMDSGLLQAALSSETGRVGLLSQLENTIASVSSEQFNQELALLGLPGTFMEGNAAAAKIRSNAEGIQAQQDAKTFGDFISIFD